MRKVKKVIYAYVFVSLLSGCAKASDNTIASVEEIQITQQTSVNVEDETPVQQADKEENLLDSAKDYISDEHFYDENEIDYKQEVGGYFHMKVFDAFTFDSSSPYEEFISKEYLVDIDLKEAEEKYGREAFTWVCVPVEITNIENTAQRLYVGGFQVYTRISDDRLTEYGLSDKRIVFAGLSGHVWYDYPDKVNEKKSYNYVDLQPGQTMSTNLFYLLLKEDLSKDLYINLYWTNGVYNTKLKCELPPTAEEVKFIKMNVKEEN